MTLVMAYCVLLSAAVAAIATIADHVLRARRIASRGLWLAATVLIVPVTGFVMLAPRPVESTPAVQLEIPMAVAGEIVAGPVGAPPVSWLTFTDTALTLGWILASVLLIAAIVFGRWRVSREKGRARAGTVQGHDVLLTDDLGPAVAGVRQPVVFVPGWVVAMDDASQRLLLAHEVEHVRRRDTGMLMAGAALTALVPWNPVAWWLARRLRIAVELDCDARVLAAHPDVRRYADLLLVAAGKPKFTSRFLAAHFGEHMSDLERRIEAMTNTKWQFRSVLLAAIAAVGLTMASCEAPRPEPLAPGKAKQATETPTAIGAGEAYLESQVEKPVTRAENSASPKFPNILREAGVEGEVLVSFVVDETGVADPASFKVIRATHELFATAVREALPAMRFTPAQVGGRKVRQLVEAPFSFALVGSKATIAEVRGSVGPVVVTGVTGNAKELAYVVRRSDAIYITPPNVVILSADGKELAKGAGEGLLKQIAPETIHSIEVLKGKTCAPYECPLIKITLAKDKTLGPPQVVRPGREQAWEPKKQTSGEANALAEERRRYELLSSPMNFEILSSTGEVVARYGSRQDLMRLGHISDDLSASRTYSARECAALAGVTCPLTRLTLKPGLESKYRKR